MFPSLLLVLLALSFPFTASAEEEIHIVASIRPIHSLVAKITDGVANPTLLVDGNASVHGYQLTPSARAALEHADVVFYVDEILEGFLTATLQAVPRSVMTVALSKADGISLLRMRSGGSWQAHSHTGHAHKELTSISGTALDYHIWLDPFYALCMARLIEERLSTAYPQHAATFKANLARLETELAQLDAELKSLFAPVQKQPFIVFHDGMQYLEARYGLSGIGAISMQPEQPLSARRMAIIRARIEQDGNICVFSEPQFSQKLVTAVTEGTRAHTGLVDVTGISAPLGKDQYITMMRYLGTSITKCLSSFSG